VIATLSVSDRFHVAVAADRTSELLPLEPSVWLESRQHDTF